MSDVDTFDNSHNQQSSQNNQKKSDGDDDKSDKDDEEKHPQDKDTIQPMDTQAFPVIKVCKIILFFKNKTFGFYDRLGLHFFHLEKIQCCYHMIIFRLKKLTV